MVDFTNEELKEMLREERRWKSHDKEQSFFWGMWSAFSGSGAIFIAIGFVADEMILYGGGMALIFGAIATGLIATHYLRKGD